MRRFFVLILFCAVVLSLGIQPQMISAQDETGGGVLQVVDTDPLPGQELGLTDPIVLYFDRPLDCSTAETSLGIKPEVAVTLTCEGTMLLLTPDTAFERATTYTLTLRPSLTAQDGASLLEPLTLTFNVQGYLNVSEVFPAANATVPTDSLITIIFNRPVVPLVIVEDMDSLPQPLSFSPAVSGTGEWLNTSIYVFEPDESLAGNTTYTVTVDRDLTAVDGAVMSAEFSYTFSTQPPEVIEVIPSASSSNVALDRSIQVRFSQPMDRASVETNFYVRLDVDADVPAVTGTFEWADDDAGFMFTPDENLFLESLYVAGFNDGVLDKTGSAGLTGVTQWNFATVPAPAIVGTDPFDGQIDAPPYGGFTIYFASPMDIDTLPDKITIEPEPPQEPDFYYRTWDDSYSVSFPTEPSTQYSISIESGMADLYGNTIESPFDFSYTTSAYSADVSLQVPGPVGFYNASRDATQLFLTHRNVSRLNLNLYNVPVDSFIRQVTGENYYYPTDNYLPPRDTLLRSWQIESEAPENAWRYELLTLGAEGESGGATTCEGAPPTRLKVGDTAIVTSDPDPLRARSTPPDGEIVDLLYKDYQLPVVGGPTCVNGILWWEVQLRDETNAWVAEGIGDEYFMDLQIAGGITPVTVDPLGNGDGKLAPGVYFLSVTSPETQRLNQEPREHFLMVSTANLTMKMAIDSATVWATDIQTGEPLAGVPIAIYDRNLDQIGGGFTDFDGVVTIDLPRADDLYSRRVAVLDTDELFAMSMTEWSQGLEPWSFGQNYDYFPRRYSAYIYTDRPIYRPGQPVYFRGIVRLKDDVSYTPPDLESVPVTIYDDRGEVVFSQNIALTPFGTFSEKIDLAEDASLGYYRVEVELPTQQEYQYEGGSVSFTVAEFRLPEFQVEMTPTATEVVQDDTIEVTVDSTYFFGGPVSNANVSYNVIANPYFFRFDGPGYYDFDDFSYDGGPSEYYGSGLGMIASGEGTTDSQGMLTIEVPASLEDATQSQTFTIEAVVADESQQSVAGRTDVIVHKGEVYVGLRPESYVSRVGEDANIEIISVNWDSEFVPNQAVEVEVVERRWSSVQEQDDRGRTTWTWEVEEIPVTEGSVNTGEDGKTIFTFTPPNGGIFKVIATTRDEAGNEIVASTMMWVSSSNYVSWRQQNSNRIDLVADQEDYNVGDTAQILITSPFQGTAEALVTVERSGVLTSERITLDSNSYVYDLSIEDDFAPNVYVSVFIVKGVDENNPVAAYRMGMVQLGVNIERKEINIEIASDKEQAAPRETITYTVRTTDFNGEPVTAEVGVSVTDLASLSLLPPNSIPLLQHFYGVQGVGVRTSTPLTMNTDELTQTTLDTVKGGGGGGAMEAGVPEIRGNFVDTAYWNGTVVTDENGFATFEVTLPDNLTTWRLDARAVTSGSNGLTLVGQNTFDLLSTKPLLIRPQTPRFFVVGDEVTLAAVVNNNTGAEQVVDVSLQSTGVTPVSGDTTQTVTIPADSRARVTWVVNVDDVEFVSFAFIATSQDGAYGDASVSGVSLDDQGTLPVYRYEVPETVGTAGLLREGGSRTESIVLPQRFDVTQGELTVRVDQSLAATTIDGLDYLRNYPHQCVEQTVSRFLPNIMTYRALNNLGLADAELERNLNSAVNFAIQKLYAEQKSDGGWGWFVQDVSNPITTAYALIGLSEALNSGFPIDTQVIANAQAYLRSQFVTPGLNQPVWRMNRQVFILYALARSGQPDVARTVTMFENRANLSIYSKALLAQTFAMIDPSDTSRSDVLVTEFVSSAITSATGIHWEEDNRDFYNWNTNTRTTAMVLGALVQLRPDSDLIPNVVRYLMVQRQADAWETTQETAWAVMALTDWMVVSGELQPNYDYLVTLNGESLTAGTATIDTVRDSETLQVQVAELLADEANNLIFGRSDGEGVLYYTAHLRAFLPVPEIEPLDRGIIINRRYVMPGDEDKTPITEVRAGEIVQVRLTIIVPNGLHYVVIEDPLPAGAEGIDPQLETSQQIGTRPGLDNNDPLSRGWGWWWFSNIEFRDEKVVLYSTYLPGGTYEYVYSIRAGFEGTYNVIPATGQEFYFPEVYGRSAGTTFTILPAGE